MNLSVKSMAVNSRVVHSDVNLPTNVVRVKQVVLTVLLAVTLATGTEEMEDSEEEGEDMVATEEAMVVAAAEEVMVAVAEEDMAAVTEEDMVVVTDPEDMVVVIVLSGEMVTEVVTEALVVVTALSNAAAEASKVNIRREVPWLSK